jgi:hypothetical protein
MQQLTGLRFGTRWSRDHFNGAVAFNNMRSTFEEVITKRAYDLCESFYTFGGQTVRMRVVGRELADHIYRPFSHLRIAGPVVAAPQLTIDLWDENELPAGCRIDSGHNDHGWIETTVKSSDGRFIGQQLPNTLTCLDRKAKQIIGSVAWSDRIFIYERAKPLARPLLEWHNDCDIQVIHAALVARNGQGVLFAGRSGSGKSTSALVCVCAGFNYLSEDYVGLERLQDGSFVGHSLYNSVFLKTDHLMRFADLFPYAIKGRLPDEEKSAVILSRVFPERRERAVPIRVLVVPRIAEIFQPRFRPASKSEALLALGPSSLLQIPSRGLGIRGFEKLVHLIERVPCYWFEVGRDLAAIAHRVDDLLTEVRSSY